VHKRVVCLFSFSNLHHREQEGEEDHLYSSSEEFLSLLAQAKAFGWCEEMIQIWEEQNLPRPFRQQDLRDLEVGEGVEDLLPLLALTVRDDPFAGVLVWKVPDTFVLVVEVGEVVVVVGVVVEEVVV